MDERDLEPEETLSGRGVDQVGAGVRELGKRRTKVGDLVGDVMHAGAALGEEPPDRSVFCQRLEQLDAPVADPQRGSSDALVVDGRPMLDPRPEEPLVGAQRLVEVLDRDTQVMDPPRLHPREAI